MKTTYDPQYRIIMKKYDGIPYWTVERRDEKPFTEDGVCGYNFSMENWGAAIDCKIKLEQEAKWR